MQYDPTINLPSKSYYTYGVINFTMTLVRSFRKVIPFNDLTKNKQILMLKSVLFNF
jgi:hypothetical protein